MFLDYKLASYLVGVEGALEEERIPAKYLTNVCPECGDRITTWDQATRDVHIVSNTANYGEPKVYAVIVACEGYWVINPEVLGLPRDNWQDWTEVTPEDVEDANGATDYPACANPECDYRLCYMERRDLDECPSCQHEIPVSLRLNDTMDGPRA